MKRRMSCGLKPTEMLEKVLETLEELKKLEKGEIKVDLDVSSDPPMGRVICHAEFYSVKKDG